MPGFWNGWDIIAVCVCGELKGYNKSTEERKHGSGDSPTCGAL
jgi:hypothetical protein